MKKIQTPILNIIAFLIVTHLFSVSVSLAQSSQSKLKKADSLFAAKLYTQSFDLYKDLFSSKMYSPAMLLKMAFIQEGLGHLSQSLYYLNLYSQPTNNSQTEEKIKELALKKNLEGYNHPSSDEKLTRFLQENQLKIASVFIGIILLLVGFIFFQKTKTQQIPVASAIILVGFLTMLFWLINFTDPEPSGIIEASNTYIMEGPSSGSAVLAIIGEGHKLIVDGKYDVWLKIKWNGKVAFVKESSLLLLHLN